MKLQYTRYKPEYFAEGANLMSQTWNFNEGFEGPVDPKLIYEVYFQLSLQDAGYTDFIVDENNRVLGYLLASVPKQKSLLASVKSAFNRAKTIMGLLRHVVLGHLGNRQNALDVINVQSELDKEIHKDQHRFDSEVILFFMSDELRGQGCGRKLMERYFNFCRDHLIRKVFLFTDLGCNFGFYDHNGFRRYKSFHHPALTAPEQEHNGFIYTKSIE